MELAWLVVVEVGVQVGGVVLHFLVGEFFRYRDILLGYFITERVGLQNALGSILYFG